MGTEATLAMLRTRQQFRSLPGNVNPETLAGKLLAAALTLNGTFTAEDLCVAAWKTAPDVFGMVQYDHPDLHRVVWLLSGKSGLVGRGALRRVAKGVYEVVR